MSARLNEDLRLSLQAEAEQELREACAHGMPPTLTLGRSSKLAVDTFALLRGAERVDAYGDPSSGEREQAALDLALKDFDLIARTTDPAGFVVLYDRAGRIVRVNDGCKQSICGNEAVERERFWDTFSRPDNRASMRHACMSLVRNDGLCEWEGACLSHDAHEHTIRWRLTALDRTAASYVIAVGNDHTHRQQMQAQLLSLDRLAAMGTLAAGMGHEINNPLAYLMMSLELAARSATRLGAREDGPDTRRLKELLVTASEGAERIRVIVDELRTMARSEQRPMQAVDVCAVLDSCVQIAGNEIRHRARLVKDYGDVPLVEANRNRLGQVFLNLIINAAQSIPEGHAADNIIRLVVRAVDGDVLVEVHDSGSGIEPEHKAHVFDPFFTTKAMGEGLGLGLSVCRSIVNELAGSIDVESERDKGSMFRVSLHGTSFEEQVAEREKVQAERARAEQRTRILIVDDEVNVVELLSAMLVDHDVSTATNCRDALRKCARYDFDLILCDVQMPELTGEDFHRELQRMRPGFESRIVFMTGGVFTKRAQDFIAKVENRVLCKPFNLDDVLKLTDSKNHAGVMQ